MAVKNITVAVPDDVYRAARVRAAEAGTSVSSLVADFLRTFTADDAEFDRLAAQQRWVTKTVGQFSAADRLGRAEVHDRAVR